MFSTQKKKLFTIVLLSTHSTTTKKEKYTQIVALRSSSIEIQSDFSSLTLLDNESFGSYLCPNPMRS